nr:dTDP-glucose 4,6-dehydratase [Lysinibacillus timonensis]
MSTFLITGGAGFIGSNYLNYIVNKYPSYQYINLDLLTYAGNLENISELKQYTNYNFVHGSICDRQLIEYLFQKFKIDGIIHFAAESHVDNSIKNPDAFIKTNVNGTFTLLEVARNFWMDAPNKYKKGLEHARFLHISTDEVFGSLGDEGLFTETTPYAPNSPYSASKAASDMLVRSYYQTYGMNVVTTNCSNNYGPMQHDEKLIPTIIRKALALESIPIYGFGLNIRDWLYVEDHCHAIELVYYNGKPGESYLIGGNNEKTNIEIVNTICMILDEKMQDYLNSKGIGSFKELITFVQDRAGHDFRYAIDASKIRRELDWKPIISFDEGLRRTVSYYLNKFTGNI